MYPKNTMCKTGYFRYLKFITKNSKTSRIFTDGEESCNQETHDLKGVYFMLHPSYTDLIEAVNSDVEPGEQPVVQSRYSIVIAASKRARQLIAGDKPLVAGAAGKKPLSTAVQELYEQKVKILTEDEEPEIETDFEVKDRTPEEIKKEEEYAEE